MKEYSTATHLPTHPQNEELRIDAPVWLLQEAVQKLINVAENLRHIMNPILQANNTVAINVGSGEVARSPHECIYGERILSSVDQVEAAIAIINDINRRL